MFAASTFTTPVIRDIRAVVTSYKAERAHERRPHDARVTLSTVAGELEGWTLNVSDGGVRVIVPAHDAERVAEAIATGRVDVAIEGDLPRCGRVAWHAAWPGGLVLGLAFGA